MPTDHGIRYRLDGRGPVLWTRQDDGTIRRMTAEEVEKWLKSKSGKTKVRPIQA